MTAAGQKKRLASIATTEMEAMEREAHTWAANALKWWLARLMRQLAASHEKAAAELRKEASR